MIAARQVDIEAGFLLNAVLSNHRLRLDWAKTLGQMTEQQVKTWKSVVASLLQKSAELRADNERMVARLDALDTPDRLEILRRYGIERDDDTVEEVLDAYRAPRRRRAQKRSRPGMGRR